MLTPDTLLQNRYLIIHPIGQGGMGAVYLARDQRLRCTVALKETLVSDDSLRNAFEREAELLANLRHPALTKVTDHFTEAYGQFLVMEYIAGDNLEEMLEHKGEAFLPDDVLVWADQLLDALDYLHTQEPPIFHRDIKPQNLKLTNRKQIVLLDFGLAKGTAGQMSLVTGNKSIFGYTPTYAPLEQVQGSGTDARSDLYSLAATLYHLITDATPPTAQSRADAFINGEPDPLRPANELNPQVFPSVANVLIQAMALKRDQRPNTAAEMRSALQQAGHHEPSVTKPRLEETALPPTVVSPQVEESRAPAVTRPAVTLRSPVSSPAATLATPLPQVTSRTMLKIEDVSVSYGAIEALTNVSLYIDEGEVVTLIGANGAGKTTTLRTITGLLEPREGRVMFEGEDISGTATHKLVARGISMSPEGRGVFANLSVRENLQMGAYLQKNRAEIAAGMKRVFEMFPRLKERENQKAGTLSGGEQQMLAMGRALMSRPRLLLLDEPSLGLAPLVVHTIFEAIDDIRSKGTTILLVEQNAHAALKHSDRCYVLETGGITMEGPSKDLANDPRIKEAYLGE